MFLLVVRLCDGAVAVPLPTAPAPRRLKISTRIRKSLIVQMKGIYRKHVNIILLSYMFSSKNPFLRLQKNAPLLVSKEAERKNKQVYKNV